MPNAIRLAALVAALVTAAPVASAAPTCFAASGIARDDAQALRLQADALGWTVGMVSSMSAGGFIKSKVALYPKGQVTVCLADEPAGLAMRVQSSTGDDKDAAWRKLPAKRKGA